MGRMTDETKLIKFIKMKKSFEENGCELLEFKYKTAKTKLKYKTICNHFRVITWNNFSAKLKINNDVLYCLDCCHKKWLNIVTLANQKKGCSQRKRTTSKLLSKNNSLTLIEINDGEVKFKCKTCKQISTKTLRNFYYIPWCSSRECTEKRKTDSYLKKYGKLYYTQTDTYHENQYKLKKKNKSHATSSYEKIFNALLLKHELKFESHYKSNSYPFICDFYLNDFDIYIELNLHWTHGKMPYDVKSNDHKNVLKQWLYRSEELSFKSKKKTQYLNAINTWSIKDIEKRNIAIKNNLNYIEVYNKKKFQEIITFILENKLIKHKIFT